MGRLRKVGEVAAGTGVSIRTLHHYDRIGLLRPARRGAGDYRLYADEDLLRLQQILTLRFLGFPLKQIGELLDRPEFDLVASLRIQRRALDDRIGELEQARSAIGALLERRVETGEWDWDLVARASEAVASMPMEGEQSSMEKYYTPEEMQKFADLRATTSEEEVAAVQDGWTALLAEVRANPDLDPASPEAQSLAERWDELTVRVIASFQGEPALLDKIRENYNSGVFEGNAQVPQAADYAFIDRIRAHRDGNDRPE